MIQKYVSSNVENQIIKTYNFGCYFGCYAVYQMAIFDSVNQKKKEEIITISSFSFCYKFLSKICL